jgi:uncharacterized protein (TIRG00374 family)
MRLDWRGALGITLSAALLWWTLRGENLGAIWQALSASNLWLFLLATVVCTLIFPLRALRWRTILAPVAGRVAYGPLWRATSIGMMVNNVVPARAGEFARAFALAREVPNVPFATALASLAVDRMFDAVVVLLLTFVPLLSDDFPRNASASAIPLAGLAKTAIASIVLLLFALYALALFPTPIIRAFEVATRKVAPGIERRGAAALAAFADGLGVLRHPGRFVAVFLWTMAHWIVQTLSIWIGFRAMHIEVPASASLLLNGVSSFASVLPSAPGFFGTFELASLLSLRVYGVQDTVAKSWAIGYHVLTFIPITVIGAIYAARLGVSLRDMTASREDEG